MGNILSCKQKKKQSEQQLPKKSAVSQVTPRKKKKKKRGKQMVLDKNRKIIQKDKELYKVVFDPDGFSVHDLALLGQPNVPDTLIRKSAQVPRQMGRVDIIGDISKFLVRQSPPLTPGKSPTGRSPNNPVDFEIVEILDYIDDLYLQLLEPFERNEPGAQPEVAQKESTSTSTIETNISAK